MIVVKTDRCQKSNASLIYGVNMRLAGKTTKYHGKTYQRMTYIMDWSYALVRFLVSMLFGAFPPANPSNFSHLWGLVEIRLRGSAA